MSISDDELPTHEAIGRARLQMQSRQWLAGKFNPQFADKPTTQVGLNVGVQIVLPEAERQKLIERRDRALLANQNKAELLRSHRQSRDAIGYAKFRSRSHHALIRVYDETGNVIETHEHKGDFKECS
jgi:hypothetical protein